MQAITHGDLRRRHVGPDLDLRLARHRLGAVRIQSMLRLHHRADAANRGAVDHRRAQWVQRAQIGLAHRLFGGGQGKLCKQIGAFLNAPVHPIGRIKILHH